MLKPLNVLLVIAVSSPATVLAGNGPRGLQGVPAQVQRKLPRDSKALVLRSSRLPDSHQVPSAILTRFRLWQPNDKHVNPAQEPTIIEEWAGIPMLRAGVRRLVIANLDVLGAGSYQKLEGPTDYGDNDAASQVAAEMGAFLQPEDWTPDKDRRGETGDDAAEAPLDPSIDQDGNSIARVELQLYGSSVVLRLDGQRGLEDAEISYIVRPGKTMLGGFLGVESYRAGLAEAMRVLPWPRSKQRPFDHLEAAARVDFQDPDIWSPRQQVEDEPLLTQPGSVTWDLGDEFFARATVDSLLHGPPRLFQMGTRLRVGDVFKVHDFEVELIDVW